MTWTDPKQGSVGLSKDLGSRGTLAVWVVGQRWPLSGTIIVKTAAWR